MREIWQKLGIVAFWLSWPALWFYLKDSTRTRVLVINGNEMLIVRSWLGTGDWDVPGGGLHGGELPADGAVREVHEETGIKIEKSQLIKLGNGKISKYGLHYKYKGFAVVLSDKPTTKSQRLEIVSVKWIPMANNQSERLSYDAQLVLSQWQQRR